ncbi:hypothetical protein [Nitratidesulfovibrio sp.]|uniref:hypothetical protein n=1 Tax=Nitratidesulfovibrio sp. TaxID=2802297 RepID=UPI00333E2A7B
MCNKGADDVEKKWAMAHSLIKLENDLVNHRMTAVLASNAFLFAAFLGVGDRLLARVCAGFDFKFYAMMFVMLVIPVCGYVISRGAAVGVRAASRHICASRYWFCAWCDGDIADVPRLVGRKCSADFLLIVWNDSPYEQGEIGGYKIDIAELGSGVPCIPVVLARIWVLMFAVVLICFAYFVQG